MYPQLPKQRSSKTCDLHLVRSTPPRQQLRQDQTCELDHTVPLELGGAVGMGNIWPECGPADVTLRERYFKQKDR